MHDKLEPYLSHWSAYQEVNEGGIGYLDTSNPSLDPVISIGHGGCSDYIFLDIGNPNAPTPAKGIVFHSSLNGFAGTQPERQRAAFLEFLKSSQQVVGFSINRTDRTGAGFMKCMQQLAHQYGQTFKLIEPVVIGHGSKAGWAALYDLHQEKGLKIQIAGRIEEYDISEHIKSHLLAIDKPARNR